MSDDNKSLLQVKNLKTWFNAEGKQPVRAVDGVSFEIKKGETFALLGESGCGKSMSSLSIMRLVPEPGGRIVEGQVLLDGKDLLALPEVAMRDVRGGRIAMIFQEPMTSLNPVLTVGRQIEEAVIKHRTHGEHPPRKKVLELLQAVGIPDPHRRYREYPHQLSGGMKQRVMIAIALAGEPDLLIADEPTTALDVTIQAQVLELLKELQQKLGMAIMLITHDLGVVAEMADRVAVMYAGEIVEQADREQFFRAPLHPYTRKLFASLPGYNKRNNALAVIQGAVPPLNQDFAGCRFESRCDQAEEQCRSRLPQWQEGDKGRGVLCHRVTQEELDAQVSGKKQTVESPLDIGDLLQEAVLSGKTEDIPKPREASVHQGRILSVSDLKVHFPVTKGLFKKVVAQVKAVDGLSLQINAGQTLALVGESGCGKTTVGKAILQLIRPTDGAVNLGDVSLTHLSNRDLRVKRGDMQIIFQDPFSSMNPRMMVGDIIEEGMVAQGVGGDAAQRQQAIDKLLDHVGLSKESKSRYPHEFSGGQRQRICIARALAVQPKLIICDEPTSALDVSVQAQILNLLKDLQEELGLAYLFITHDLSVVEYLAHDVAVMYLGRIVESGSVENVIQNPMHPYTKALLSAVPEVDLDSGRKIIRLRGEMPSPVMPPIGCHFNPRCAKATQICRNGYPQSRAVAEQHEVRCFLYESVTAVDDIPA